MNPRNISQHQESRGLNARTPEPTKKGTKPALIGAAGTRIVEDMHKYRYLHETVDLFDPANPSRVLRTANIFSFVNLESDNMVELKHDDNTKQYTDIEMIAYITPLNGGQRKGYRALSGYTPLYSCTDPRVWNMEGDFARVRVQWPLLRKSFTILGNEFDGVWITSTCGRIVYMLQHPDPSYESIYKQTVQNWERATGDGDVQRLFEFESVDLTKPCKSWLDEWVYNMLRLEERIVERIDTHGGAERLEGQDTVDDASSLLDEEAGELPHSTRWDWGAQEQAAPAEATNTVETMGSQDSAGDLAPLGHSSPLFPPSDSPSETSN